MTFLVIVHLTVQFVQGCSSMEKTQFNQSEIHRITGKSRTTIKKHIEKGKLSSTQDDDGNKLVDASELIRVYGQDNCDFAAINSNDKNETSKKAETKEPTKTIDAKDVEIQYLKKIIENHERENESFKDALKLSQEGHNRATMLLEDKSGGAGDLEKGIKALEARVANQERTNKEILKAKEAAEQNLKRYKRALRTELNKTFLEKLFSKKPKQRVS